MKIKIRPAILLGEVILGIIAWGAIQEGMTELATACVVGIAALLPKLVESEEKSQ
jgi:hypothetical protein